MSNHVSGALVKFYEIECSSDPKCVKDAKSNFRKEWDECFSGQLTKKEKKWSDRITRVWANFIISGY